MDGNWRVIYYQTENNISPVHKFINSLDPKSKSKIIKLIDLLEEFGTHLGWPYAKKLTGTELWELRILGQDNIRIFYVAVVDKSFLLIHGFTKKKQKTDLKEIKTALERLKIYRKYDNIVI